jgi:hypothetical protein
MREVDPLDLVETIREGLLVLDPDLTVRFANRSFGETFAVIRSAGSSMNSATDSGTFPSCAP